MSSCKAIAFEDGKDENVFHFMTASSCVATDDLVHERANLTQKNFFIALNEGSNTNFFAAKVIAAGYQTRGDNFAVLESRLNQRIKTEPDMAKNPLFKRFWSEVKDGKYKWFSPD